jgi:anti-sigma B factor antagonist
MEGTTITISPCPLDQSIKVILLPAKIDSLTAEKISLEVLAALEGNPGGVLFNMKEVAFVSSAGIRMFMKAYKKAQADGFKMAMIHVHPSIYKIFKVAVLESAFNIFDSEAEALKGLWLLNS